MEFCYSYTDKQNRIKLHILNHITKLNHSIEILLTMIVLVVLLTFEEIVVSLTC